MNELQDLWTEYSLESLQKKTPVEIQYALKKMWLELEQNGEEEDGTD